MSGIKKASCCYNCKHSSIGWLIHNNGWTKTMYKCEKLDRTVKIDHVCDKWEKAK